MCVGSAEKKIIITCANKNVKCYNYSLYFIKFAFEIMITGSRFWYIMKNVCPKCVESTVRELRAKYKLGGQICSGCCFKYFLTKFSSYAAISCKTRVILSAGAISTRNIILFTVFRLLDSSWVNYRGDRM